MRDCKNVEHKKPCHKKEICRYCGKSTCLSNYAYHFCQFSMRVFKKEDMAK